ncbi:MAG TPA: hypothetical protein VGP46_05640, partial [Acidimicrobiales bacterium]|nr:hypothetical protein [Acidimicrobiales bacterium]
RPFREGRFFRQRQLAPSCFASSRCGQASDRVGDRQGRTGTGPAVRGRRRAAAPKSVDRAPLDRREASGNLQLAAVKVSTGPGPQRIIRVMQRQ